MINSEEDRHLKLAGDSDCAPEPLPTLRHSTAHLMAQAVKQLFPEVKVTIGPAIEDGFYYDFAKPTPFTPEDLERIESRMRELAKADEPFVRTELPREEAIRFFEERDEPFKVEIIRGLDAPTVSLYKQGDFIDLCRGPHVARVLARQREEPDAPTHLRHGVAHPGGAGSIPLAPRGSQETGPPEARPRAGPLRLLRHLAGRGLLAAGRDGAGARAREVRPRIPGCPRLPGDRHSHAREQEALGAVRALGTLQRQHVQTRDRGGDVQPQADELPRVVVRVPARPALLPRPAPALLGDGPLLPQRALGRALGSRAGAPVHPG